MSNLITQMRPGPADNLTHLHFGLYDEASTRGISLTEMIERDDPDSRYPVGSRERDLGAIGRILDRAGPDGHGIRLRSLPRRGIQASTYEQWAADQRANVLIPEFFVRTFQSAIESHREQEERRVDEQLRAQARAIARAQAAQGDGNGQRATLMDSSDALPGSALFPYFNRPEIEWSTQVSPPIPLTELLASETGITGDSYRTTRLTRVAADLRTSRIEEGAEIPRMRVATSDYINRLAKFGLGVEWTYEVLRRMQLDEVARITAEIAVQQEVDKVTVAADIAYNGDGSTGSAAAVTNLTTLDSAATPPTITLKAWVAFKMLFAQPYVLTTALGTTAAMQQLLLLNTGSANMPLVVIADRAGLGGFTQINPGLRDNVAIGWTTDVPASKILAFDRRRTLRRVFEAASLIREVERFVLRQTQVITFTENETFVVVDPDAAQVLNLAA
jgi:hypothetical protein